MNKIENPKVFISYAWKSQDYQQKVLDFAKSLKRDGVEVLIDLWAVVGGNDLYNYMEKSVKEETVTNVLILLDPKYAEKADKREGGVGTETQIISQEIYGSVNQDKFIPVIFERDENGKVCKPVFLKSLYYYDLSREDCYDIEYKKLLKHLYGREVYIEPELGSKPAWIDEEIEIAPKKHSAFDMLKENNSPSVKTEQFRQYLSDISDCIVEFGSCESLSKEPNDYIAAYDSNKPIRSEYLALIGYHHYLENSIELIGDFFENTYNRVDELNSNGKELSYSFLHELFIYTIAMFLKQKYYSAAGYLLGRTYFVSKYVPCERGYDIFYSGNYHRNLDSMVNAADKKNYYSGTANHWIDNIEVSFCSKKDFIFADEICSNYSIYGNDYAGVHPWFPLTYIYDDEYNSTIKELAVKLISREKLSQILVLFNHESIETFKKKLLLVNMRIHDGDLQNYGYNSAFWNVPLLSKCINIDQIGTKR